MRTILILTLLSVLSFFSTGFSQPAGVSATNGLLYKISGKDLKRPSYLFGTIHVICSKDMFSLDELGNYFDQTEQLILEIDMDDAAEMREMATGIYLQNGKTLHDYYTPDERKKLNEFIRTYLGTTFEAVKNIKPVILQTMILTSPKVIGCAPPASYEAAFLKMTLAQQKPVEGLEKVQAQFAVLDKTSMEKQAADFYKMAVNPEKSVAELGSLVDTYKLQNSDNLYALVSKQMVGEQAFQISLLDERNKIWVPKIKAAITEKPSFIAVGGAHLGGKNGIVNLLRAQGYKLEPISLQ